MNTDRREHYLGWRAAVDEALDAYTAWSAAPPSGLRGAYAVYRAAADREDAAAAAFLESCASDPPAPQSPVAVHATAEAVCEQHQPA